MATKLLEYTFNNTISDCIPQFIGLSSDGYTISDSVSDNITTRIINVNDGVSLPTRIWFSDDSHPEGRSLLTLEYLDTSNINNMSMLFCYCNYLTSVNTIGWDTSKVTDMTLMFFLTSNLQNLTLSNFDITNCTSFHRMFEKSGIVELNFIGNSTNSSVGKNMNKMFADCNKLTKLSISNIPNINNMSWMFSGCSKLESLNLIGLDTSNCTDFTGMFYGCSSLTSLDLSSFNTSKANSMQQMFIGCNKITSLDLSNFNTSKVTDMAYMFQNCSSLTSLDLSSFNTSNVTNMSYMFSDCANLTLLDLSNFDISKITGMAWMFNRCSVPNIGLLYATSSTINGLLAQLGTSTARNIYYIDAPLNELTVQDNITYKKYELTMATLPYTLNKLPNGVADYIDVVNKVHVQRVGVLSDLRNNFTGWYRHSLTTSEMFVAAGHASSFSIEYIGMVDKVFTPRQSTTEPYSIYITGDACVVTIPQSDLVEDSLDAFKNKLAEINPTILYKMKTPIYTPLTEEEIAQLPLSAYADGYVMLSSDQLTPSFEFRMRTSNRYQVDMLETGYYYLNAPVGNVKLGTANVDVQQMPCIVKVDNVGTGDSGYRLSITEGFYVESTSDDFVLFDQRLSADGSIVEQSNMGITDYYNIPLLQNSSYIFNHNKADNVNVFVAFYDTNKTYISTDWHDKNNTVKSIPKGTKYIRLSYAVGALLEIRMFTPITLAKLPSHRIPSPFTQGMASPIRNLIEYWEGIKEAQVSMYRTYNGTSVKDRVNLSKYIELNRIEISSTSLIVEDEFDIATGKFTKRIGKVVFDGSSDENWYSRGRDETYVRTKFFIISLPTKSRENYICINNRLPYDVGWNGDFERLWIDNRDSLVVHTDKAFSVDSFRKYLASNPIIVYYPLEVPEISCVDLPLNTLRTLDVATTLQVANQSIASYLLPQVKPSHH